MKRQIARPVVFALISCFSAISGQVTGKTPSLPAPHIVRILLDSGAAQQFRPGFAVLRAGQTDIQKIAMSDSSAIESILHLPPIFHNISIKPYLPEHSVVFEDIREHINPVLFRKDASQTLSINAGAQNSDDISLLRKSEERLSRWFILRYSDSISPEIASKLCRKSHNIQIAEPLYPATPQYIPDTPNDPMIGQQYALAEINAFNAWGVVTCDSTMVVADVDVGVDMTHPDLAGAVWNDTGETGLDANGQPKDSNQIDDDGDGFVDDWRGWDFAGASDNLSSPDNDPSPGPGINHGTLTSGLLAATGNNHVGIAGIAFGAKFIPIKAESDNGDKIYYVFPGIVFAADHGARVISCSVAEDYQSSADEDVVNYAYAKGSVLAVASANYLDYFDYYPASYQHAFSVGATDSDGQIAFYSTFNRNVAVAAPGTAILSTTLGDTYTATENGTSLSCPEVAGGIALILESALKGPLHAKYPNITAGQAMAQMRATTNPIPNDPNSGFDGTGIIDLFRAVTDTNAHELRIESFDVLNGTNDGILTPGTQATLRIHLKNYLAPLSNALAEIAYIDSNGSIYGPDTGIVHSSVRSLPLGAFGTLAESTTDPNLFHITVDNAAPPGSTMLIKFTFRDTGAGYTYSDYDYIKLTISPGYRTLDTNNILVSIYDNGEIGHQSDQDGDGFIWQNAPEEIYGGNRDLLYDGGLMIAADANRLAESMGLVQPNQSGFSGGPISRQAITSPAAGDEVTTSFAATLADPTDTSGLLIDERAIEFTDPAAANAMILDYDLHGARNLTSFDAGLYMDWDLGDGGFSNYAAWEDSSGIMLKNDSVMIVYRLNANYPVVAMKVIARPTKSILNHFAMNGFTDLISDNVTQADEWKMLSTSQDRATYCDVKVALGAKNISIPAGGDAHLTYVIGLGTSEDSARAALFRAADLFNGTASVNSAAVTPSSGSDIWPDPAESELNVSVSSIAPGEMLNLRLTDALGRKIADDAMANGGAINTNSLPSGIYFLEADWQNNRYLRTFVKE